MSLIPSLNTGNESKGGYCTESVHRPFVPWAQIQMDHERYSTLGPLPFVPMFEQSRDTNPLLRSPTHGMTAKVDHGLSAATTQLYPKTLVVPWGILLLSTIRCLALVPTSKLLFLKQGLFLSRIIKTGPTHTSGVRK